MFEDFRRLIWHIFPSKITAFNLFHNLILFNYKGIVRFFV
jgi:hypothetical protein